MNESPSPQPPATPRLKVIGVGHAGIGIVNRLIAAGLPGASFVAVNTDETSLAATAAPQKLLIESRRLRGMGTGGDPSRGTRAAEENIERIEPLVEDADIVFVVGGLGGGTGTGVSPLVARLARKAGALVIGFVFLPFDCEGDTRALHAARGLEALKAAADGVVCLPNQKIFKLIDECASISDTFEKTSTLLADGIRAVWRLMTARGLLELGFEDLCSVLRDRHSENLFAVAEGTGAERAAEVIERLVAHPMFDEGRDLSRADAVLVSLVSGPELTMAEVRRVMSALNERCGRARVSMGACVMEEFRDRLAVTVIASCPRALRSEDPPDRARFPTGPEPGAAGLEPVESTTSPQEAAVRTPSQRPGPMTSALAEARAGHTSGRRTSRRSGSSKMQQGQLPLDMITKGRFEQGEPTLLHGQDLDVPTFVRRGVALN